VRIDPRLEERLREAYRGVAGRDGERMVAALRGLDEEDFGRVLRYGRFVIAFVLKDRFPRGAGDAELRAAARTIVDAAEGWADVGDEATVVRFLRSVAAADENLHDLDRETAVGLTFVCGGTLLATHGDEDGDWSDYLDQVWEAAFALPAVEEGRGSAPS
jgi:hypothetical protein